MNGYVVESIREVEKPDPPHVIQAGAAEADIGQIIVLHGWRISFVNIHREAK